MLARYGGDEFVIILPGANLPRALATGESMRNAIGEASFFEPSNEETPSAIPRVTASIGVAPIATTWRRAERSAGARISS